MCKFKDAAGVGDVSCTSIKSRSVTTNFIERVFVAAFVAGMIVHGSTKLPTNNLPQSLPSMQGMASTMEMQNSGEPVGGTNDYFKITDFAVVPVEQKVAFEVEWSDGMLNLADSRRVDLFMSTNLVTRNWYQICNCWMNYGTNRSVFVIDEYRVDYDVRPFFSDSFNHAAFFCFGLDVDSDEDCLTDAYERLVLGTNPLCADTDGDGMDDGDELWYELDPLADDTETDTDGDGLTDFEELFTYYTNRKNPDTDGDGLCDGDEIFVYLTDPYDSDTDGDGMNDGWEVAYGYDPVSSDGEADDDDDGDGVRNVDEFKCGSNPNIADTDGDGLSDSEEIGWIAVTNTLSWLTLSDGGTDVTSQFTDSESSMVNLPLPHPTIVGGEMVTNILIDVNGVMYLPRRGCGDGIRSSNYVNLSNAMSPEAIVLAPYGCNLCLTAVEPATRVTIGESVAGTNPVFVVQYENVCLSGDQNRYYGTNSLSFQVVIPFDETSPVHFLYKDIVGDGMDGMYAEIGIQPFGGNRTHIYTWYSSWVGWGSDSFQILFRVGMLFNGLDLMLHPGFGTDSSVADTDGDGLNDGVEATLGTAALLVDTDGDGMNDRWEMAFDGFNPIQDNSTDSDPNNDFNADPDEDGLTNGEEADAFTNPYDSDSDGDGVNDGTEILNDSDPLDPSDSTPVIWVSVTGDWEEGVAKPKRETVNIPAGTTVCVGVFVYSEEYPFYTGNQSEYNDIVGWRVYYPGNDVLIGMLRVNNEDGAWDTASVKEYSAYGYSPVVVKDLHMISAPTNADLAVNVEISAMNVSDGLLPTTVMVGFFPFKMTQSNMPTVIGVNGTTDSGTSYANMTIPSNGIAYITSQTAPPRLTAEFKGLPNCVTTSWSETLTSERADFRDAIDDRSFAGQSLAGNVPFDITAALNNEIVGGRCVLTASINGHVYSHHFCIRGKNPLDATARAYISSNVETEFVPYAWMIAKHESKSGNRVYNQFNPNGNLAELPNKGVSTNNFGWGITQIDKGRTGDSTAEVYDWHANVASMNAKLTEALNYYNRFLEYYRDLYANDPDANWTEPDNVTTMINGYAVSIKMWSVLTFYNGVKGCPTRYLDGLNRRVPFEFDPSISGWVFHPNHKDYVRLVLTDRNQTETE